MKGEIDPLKRVYVHYLYCQQQSLDIHDMYDPARNAVGAVYSCHDPITGRAVDCNFLHTEWNVMWIRDCVKHVGIMPSYNLQDILEQLIQI